MHCKTIAVHYRRARQLHGCERHEIAMSVSWLRVRLPRHGRDMAISWQRRAMRLLCHCHGVAGVLCVSVGLCVFVSIVTMPLQRWFVNTSAPPTCHYPPDAVTGVQRVLFATLVLHNSRFMDAIPPEEAVELRIAVQTVSTRSAHHVRKISQDYYLYVRQCRRSSVDTYI